MKSKFYMVLNAAIYVCLHFNGFTQANTSLSNLVAPTAINHSLTPGTTNYISLGSTSKSWKNIYIGGSIFLDGQKFINNYGLENTFIGSDAGKLDSFGHDNTANGFEALYSNAYGYGNTANGAKAMYWNTQANRNTASGNAALYSNYLGDDNTANGYQALYSNTLGFNNTANGASSMYHTVDGADNTSTGSFSLYSNTSGDENTATGRYALYTNAAGKYNTADGANALHNNFNGYYNTGIGDDALYDNNAGGYNTAIGEAALLYNNTGSYNTAVGFGALYNNTSSLLNTAVGYNAGDSYDNGYNNVFLGAETDVNGAGYYNVVAVGHATICTASSQARIGNSFTTSIGGFANWSNVSDIRVKKNIKQNVPGLAFINKLQPITYNLDLEAADEITQPPIAKDKDGKAIQPTEQELDARKAKEQIVYTGFAAQDVEKAAKSLNYDFSGVDAAKNNKDLYGLRYAEFVVPLVKAVQELSAKNDSLQKQNDAFEKRIEKLESMMNASVQPTVNNQQSAIIFSASLQQNIPNPFSNATTISYTLPQQYSSAKIIVTDKNSNTLKQINLSGVGKGSVALSSSFARGREEASGAYQYTLYVDGKMIASRQMVLFK